LYNIGYIIYDADCLTTQMHTKSCRIDKRDVNYLYSIKAWYDIISP